MTEKKQTVLYMGAALLIAIVIFAFFYQKRQPKEPITATALKLNTVVQITIYDSQDRELLEEALALCDTYEQIFSRTAKTSELYQLNHGQLSKEGEAYSVSDAMAELIAEGLAYSELSGGAFDITIEPVSSLWDFTSGHKIVPAQRELDLAKALVNYKKVSLSGKQLFFEKEGMALELGAIAKGYIADQIKEFLVSKGVKSAIIDLGGNILCIGSRTDGEPFRIGIQRPFADRQEQIAVVEIADKSVVSSGIYERFFEKNGVFYHHILNPKDGYPYENNLVSVTIVVEIADKSVVSSGIYERFFEKNGVFYHHILNPKDGYPYENNLVSVTIISDESVDGDGLSTSCFALGLEGGMELVESLPDVQAIFITEDGEVHLSGGFEEEIKITFTK